MYKIYRRDMSKEELPPILPIMPDTDPDDRFGVKRRNGLLPEAALEESSTGLIRSIRSWHSALSEKTKTIVHYGAIAVAPAVLPVYEVINPSSEETQENAELFLQGYGLLALTAGSIIAARNFKRTVDRSRLTR
jgi:hypothetical protein